MLIEFSGRTVQPKWDLHLLTMPLYTRDYAKVKQMGTTINKNAFQKQGKERHLILQHLSLYLLVLKACPLPFDLNSMDNPTEDGMKARKNLPEGAGSGSFFSILLLEDPAVAALFLTGPDDFGIKIDESKEVSGAPNETGPFCDL